MGSATPRVQKGGGAREYAVCEHTQRVRLALEGRPIKSYLENVLENDGGERGVG